MPNIIKSGTILIKVGTIFPDTVRVETEPCEQGWRAVKNLDGYGLDRRVLDAGWTSFRLAGEITAVAFGFDAQKNACKAVRRILANPKSKRFNSLEITRVVSARFWGLPCVTISAHSRHIQEGAFLFPENDLQVGALVAMVAAPAKA